MLAFGGGTGEDLGGWRTYRVSTVVPGVVGNWFYDVVMVGGQIVVPALPWSVFTLYASDDVVSDCSPCSVCMYNARSDWLADEVMSCWSRDSVKTLLISVNRLLGCSAPALLFEVKV